MSKHTPGPWKWMHNGVDCLSEPMELAGPDGEEIIFPTMHLDDDNRLVVLLRIGGHNSSDRALIAAAPELLEACKKAAWLFDVAKDGAHKPPANKECLAILATIHAAIAKAEAEGTA